MSKGLTKPIVIHYPQVMAGTSTMNGDPIFQGATVSLTDIMFGSSHATPPCGELNLLDAVLFDSVHRWQRAAAPPEYITVALQNDGLVGVGSSREK